MEQIITNFKKATWELFPVFQELHSLSYVEYFLVGRGSAYPASLQGQIPKWLGPAPLAVESAARFVACEKQRSCEAILQEKEGTGAVVMCGACRDIQSRFVMPMPRTAKQARQKQDDLLGGLEEASAGESGDEASTVSNNAGDGDESSGDEFEKEPTAKARGPISAPASAATSAAACLKIRPARQGMPASTWLQVLSLMQPSKVVLAGTVTFQAGLLYAILQYNDAIFGLQQCPLVGFCCQEPLPPTVLEWTKKHVKQWQMSHLCLHSIERALAAYTSPRYMASTANQKAAVSGGRRFLKREGTDTSAVLSAGSQAEPPQVTVSKFIMAHGNHGKDA